MTISFSFLIPLLYLFCFFLCAVHDLLTKSIPVPVFAFFFICGIPVFMFRLLSSGDDFPASPLLLSLIALLPGMLLLLLSLISKGALGLGDGYFILISGLYLSLRELFLLLLLGLLTSGILSILLLSYGKFRKRSFRKKSIPFIPCMLPAIPFLFHGITYIP